MKKYLSKEKVESEYEQEFIIKNKKKHYKIFKIWKASYKMKIMEPLKGIKETIEEIIEAIVEEGTEEVKEGETGEVKEEETGEVKEEETVEVK